VVISLAADCLHMVRLMPLPSPNPVISCIILKSRLVLPFWNRLAQVVLEKRPLNGCTSSSFKSQNNKFNIPFLTFQYTQSFHISALFSDSQGCSVFLYRVQWCGIRHQVHHSFCQFEAWNQPRHSMAD